MNREAVGDNLLGGAHRHVRYRRVPRYQRVAHELFGNGELPSRYWVLGIVLVPASSAVPSHTPSHFTTSKDCSIN